MTNMNYLDFEQPIAEIEAKIEELRMVGSDSEINVAEEISKLESEREDTTKSIFSNLKTWQIVQIARHPLRPYTLDYIHRIFTEFDELHGERHFYDDTAIVGGLARFDGMPVMVIGQQKGRSTKEKVKRNFGMPKPEGYRKALRLMKMAEKFNVPVFTFIDTAGAYPGIGAEERNQSEAIARNLFECATLKTPIICTVTGEGGSGGALAIGVGDRLLMLQYSVYSVVSPEGCASILWRKTEKAAEAAKAMGVHAEHISSLGLLDQIIPEPLGGAHRDPELMAQALKEALSKHLKELQGLPMEELLKQRRQRLLDYGIKHSSK